MQQAVLIPMSLPDFKAMMQDALKEIVNSQITKPANSLFEDLPPYLTRKQAAKVLNISITSLDYLVKDERLSKHRNGRFVRFQKEEVLNFYKTFTKHQRQPK